MTTSGEAPQPRAVDSTNAQSESSHNLSNEPNQTEIDISAYQDICERNIKPSKLAALLRNRFGVGRYEVHMIHEIYIVRAPEPLSKLEIAQCK